MVKAGDAPPLHPGISGRSHCKLLTASELKFKACRPLKRAVAIVKEYRMSKVDSQSKPMRKRVFDSPTIVEVGAGLVRYPVVVIHSIAAKAGSQERNQVFVGPEVIEQIGTILI